MSNVYVIVLANHLWQSTWFAMAVAGLTLMLRRNGARVRYCLWLAASAKFLVPFALLTAVGARIPWPAGPAHATSILSIASQLTAPIAHIGGTNATALVAPAPNSDQTILLALGLLWLVGTLAVVARTLVSWTRIYQARRESRPMDLAFVVPVRCSASQLEPAIVGILHPVLLLPEGLERSLTSEEMHAVLAHERCHVAWRDNLAAALHMLAEAIFWFHPLIWWLGTRLVKERERACDEQVLTDGHLPASYAEGILKVCEHYLASRVACVAGVSGASLRQRIDTIMKNRLTERLNGIRKLLITLAACATIAVPVGIGVLTSPRAHAQAGTPDTEEPQASIWLGSEDKINEAIYIDPGRKTGSLSNVNRPIDVGAGAEVGSVTNVNGAIEIREGATASSLKTLNGNVEVDARAKILSDASSDNGQLTFADGTEVGGSLTNVNGSIRLYGTHVAGDIEQTNGNIEVGRNSRVDGGIHVHRSYGIFNTSDLPQRVVIGPGAIVKGALRFDEEFKFKLFVSESASIGPVKGAIPIKFKGDSPPL